MKLFSSEAWSLFAIPKLPPAWAAQTEADDNRDDIQLSKSEVAYPDLTYVPDHCTAAINNDMWGHQLSKLGLETWIQKGQPGPHGQ